MDQGAARSGAADPDAGLRTVEMNEIADDVRAADQNPAVGVARHHLGLDGNPAAGRKEEGEVGHQHAAGPPFEFNAGAVEAGIDIIDVRRGQLRHGGTQVKDDEVTVVYVLAIH